MVYRDRDLSYHLIGNWLDRPDYHKWTVAYSNGGFDVVLHEKIVRDRYDERRLQREIDAAWGYSATDKE